MARNGSVLLLSAIAYFLLTRRSLALHPAGSQLAVAIGSDRKGRLSAIAYVTGIVVALFEPWVAIAIYVGVAVVWLVPTGELPGSSRVERGPTPERTRTAAKAPSHPAKWGTHFRPSRTRHVGMKSYTRNQRC